jgi:Bcr/CflA subfamily drug resistance transporter
MSTQKIMFINILLVICCAQIASDIYAPSLPAIAAYFQTPVAHVQFSMTIYMYGLGISQLFYGVLSEGIGRRRTLIAGLTILFIGNLVSLFASSITVLIVGRLIQGCGAGACSALWRSIFRDMFEGAELVKYGSYLSIFITFIVPAAPVIGGYLQVYFNWRASFAFLAIYSLSTFLMVLVGLRETSLHHHLERLKARYIFQSFKHMFSSPIFMGYTCCTFLCYGAFFSWFAVGPVLLINIIGISPVSFGWITLFCGGAATAFGAWVNGRLVTQLGMPVMLRVGFTIMLIAGIAMLVSKWIFGITLFAVVIPMIAFYFGITFIWPSAFAGAFAPYGKNAGYAGALYGFMQISGGAVVGTVVSYLPHQNQVPLAWVFIITAILAWIVFEGIVRRKEASIQCIY